MAAKLTAKQWENLDRYRELWEAYNTTADLIGQLEGRLREIKAEQRRLANQIAADHGQQEEPG